jgi:3',5'-cyclic AMP phosphodiesterase CpdA
MLGVTTRIAHISDIHFGRINAPIAEALVADLAANPSSLLVISGDLTQRARVSQYKAAAEYLQRLPSPRLVIPGNHDIPPLEPGPAVFLRPPFASNNTFPRS